MSELGIINNLNIKMTTEGGAGATGDIKNI
jgi:hypothetical protein